MRRTIAKTRRKNVKLLCSTDSKPHILSICSLAIRQATIETPFYHRMISTEWFPQNGLVCKIYYYIELFMSILLLSVQLYIDTHAIGHVMIYVVLESFSKEDADVEDGVKMAWCAHLWTCHTIFTPFSRHSHAVFGVGVVFNC